MNTSRVAKLGDVAEFIRGITFKPTDVVVRDTPGSVACMRTSNIQGSLETDDVLALPSEFVNRDEQYLRESDMLVSSANSWNLVGKACWVPDLGYLATAGGFISILRARPGKIDPRYLYRWFTESRTQTLVRNCGRQTTNISNLSIPRCLALELPLPPLAEQKRIAAVLDKADALRAKRRQALATLDTLLQCVFLDMFGDPLTKKSTHPVVPLREFLAAQSGKSSDDVRSGEPTGIPIYGGNGVNGWATRALFEEAVIVVGRVGQQCGITRFTDGPCWVTDNAIVVRVLDHSRLHPVYVTAALQRSPLRVTVERLDLPFINQSIILDQPLPLPPIALQRHFADFAAAHQQRRHVVERALARTDALFASLQSAAFAGALFDGEAAKHARRAVAV